jgi:hypothetical protein
MRKDITKHTEICTTCQERIFKKIEISEKLTPSPQRAEPNQQVHIDLFRPLQTTRGKTVFCMTESFTKYIKVIVIKNKEAVQ